MAPRYNVSYICTKRFNMSSRWHTCILPILQYPLCISDIYPTKHHSITEMSTFLLQNCALWDIDALWDSCNNFSLPGCCHKHQWQHCIHHTAGYWGMVLASDSSTMLSPKISNILVIQCSKLFMPLYENRHTTRIGVIQRWARIRMALCMSYLLELACVFHKTFQTYIFLLCPALPTKLIW